MDSIEGSYPGYIEWFKGDYPSVSIVLSHVDEVKTYFQPITFTQDLSGLDSEAREVFSDGAYLIHIEALDLGFNLTSLIGEFPVQHTGSVLVNGEGLWICLENDVNIRDDMVVFINSKPFKVRRVRGPQVSLSGENFTISTEKGFNQWLLVSPLDAIESITDKAIIRPDALTNPLLRLNGLIIQAAEKLRSE